MGDQYSFSVTGYVGHEGEILQMRNRNRESKRTREYLDWRYVGETSPTQPVIFWMRDNRDEILGMASLIFRPYAVKGERCYFGVLGDISVNEEHRGEGLSRRLFQFMNNHIEKNNLSTAFVMPNKAAERALGSAGWTTVGRLIPRVCVTEPLDKCKAVLKFSVLAKLACWGVRALARNTIFRHIRKGISFRRVEDFDQEFQTFWDGYAKKDVIMHDRGLSSLIWRYRKQPDARFSIGKFYDGDKMIGYIVSTLHENNGMCLVVDFLVSDPQLVNPCMVLFVREAMANKKIITVRIVLIEDSEYAGQLSKMSFRPRDPVTAFLIYHGEESVKHACDWFITPGDKDA